MLEEASNMAAQASVPIAAPISKAEVKEDRFIAIDMLRGIAMLLMALDHWAAFARVNITAEGYDGVRPALGGAFHIFTGLLTNLASGIFFTLTGTSIAFFERSRRKRGWTEWEITRFLLIRAGILLVLDQVVNFVGWHVTDLPLFEVLSALAFGLIVLAFARHLPLKVIAIGAGVLFLGYPLLVMLFPHNPDQPLSAVTTILLQNHRASFPNVETPFLGRLSLVLAGYVLGRLLREGKISIQPQWLWVATGGLVAWLVLRLGVLNGYGDYMPYNSQDGWLSFLIDSKHPPSLTFLLFNMSLSLMLLVGLQSLSVRLKDTAISWVLTILGQTSLFFFVLHMLFYKLLEVVFNGSFIPSSLISYDIIRLYLECALTMVVLLPICYAYRNLRRKYSILSYL
ncbi:MAG: DUF1624 domain-containing protein [Anaerolineae bacterium]|nr:DUF1624 domain-containing protein [Anaerolineae bacterium]